MVLRVVLRAKCYWLGGPKRFRHKWSLHEGRPTLFNRKVQPHRGRADFSSSSHCNSLLDNVTVTCLPGLEFVLSAELSMLGIQHRVPSSGKKKKDGKIHLQKATIDDLFRCSLYLGSASQIRLRCASFSARGLSELKRKTAIIPWKEICRIDSIKNGNVDVRVVSSKSKLYHTGAIRDRILQGIDEHFGQDNYNDDKEEEKDNSNDDKEEEKQKNQSKNREGKRSSDSAVPTVLLDVHVFRDQVQIFVNAFPIPLHQRGYRQQVAKAPLREDLAFAMLFTAGWTPVWNLDDTTVPDREWQGLVDPFCGSGTIAIEGAAMMLGLPPGRLRDTPFKGLLLEDKQKWSTEVNRSVAAANKKEFDNKLFSISASDRDSGAVEATKANAKRAGVLDALTIQKASLSSQIWFEKPSEAPPSLLVVTNPPFGKRISSKSSSKGLLTLYQSLGQCIQRLARDHGRKLCGVVLTDNTKLLSRTGASFPFKTSFKTFHGGLKVSAMKFDLSSS